jgi:hypothetical protein
MPTRPIFEEGTAERRVQSLPLAHLSIELGHLYFEDFDEGPERLDAHFEQVARWVPAIRDAYVGSRRAPRVSTCFLVDDYFGPKRPPADVLPGLIEAARTNGVPIDYIVRESACADADGVPLADLVLERIVADPAPGTNGSRPPPRDAGWLSNGKRSPGTHAAEAMTVVDRWSPPKENAANRHSIFVDVELFDAVKGKRRWSCAFLAAVWQLLRLGLLRQAGQPVALPTAWDGAYPDDWSRLPAVLKLNPSAAPFAAYRSHSVLSSRFLPTEHAVRTILSQVLVDPALTHEAQRRADAEGIALPLAAGERMSYVFAG